MIITVVSAAVVCYGGTKMKREYIGRCDMCGRNLYEDDVRISIFPVIGAAMTVCSDCSEINYKNYDFDIVDAIELIENNNLLEDEKE